MLKFDYSFLDSNYKAPASHSRIIGPYCLVQWDDSPFAKIK